MSWGGTGIGPCGITRQREQILGGQSLANMKTQSECEMIGNNFVAMAGGKMHPAAEQLYHSHEDMHSTWLSLWDT